MHQTEADLIARVRGGDSSAFGDLVEPYRSKLWGVCLRVTGSPADAEDALQDCLLAAWRNLDKFRGESAIGTWLYRIAANAAVGVVRRRREIAGEVPDRADPSPAADDVLALRDEVEAALRLVPTDFRVALVLREYGDLSYEEIAAHQGVGVQTVKSRLNRARASVRTALAAGVPVSDA